MIHHEQVVETRCRLTGPPSTVGARLLARLRSSLAPSLSAFGHGIWHGDVRLDGFQSLHEDVVRAPHAPVQRLGISGSIAGL